MRADLLSLFCTMWRQCSTYYSQNKTGCIC